jgi:hypothetical protein
MRHLAEFLEVEFLDVLLAPAFNTFGLKAHAALQDQGHGYPDAPAQGDMQLTGRQLDAIEKVAGETHSRVLSEVVGFE